MSRLLALLVLVAPAVAGAIPHDHRFDLEVGGEAFGKLWQSDEVVVEPEGIVAAEVLPSEEIRLEALAEGEATVFVLGPSLLHAWKVTVRPKGAPRPKPPEVDPLAWKAATSACPDLVRGKEGLTETLEVTVRDAGCRRALRRLLERGPWPAGDLRLTYTPEVLMEQLRELEKAAAGVGVGAKVKLAYAAATLVVRGEVTAAERRRLYAELWKVAVGRIPLDEALTIAEAPAPVAVPLVPQVMTVEEARKAGLLDEGTAPPPPAPKKGGP